MTPLVHGLVWGLVIATVLVTIAVLSIWFERKFAGRIQSRYGPTLVGPAGILQIVADALKMMQKEDIIPQKADSILIRLAPPCTVIFTLTVAAVIPFDENVLAADLDIGVLFLLAVQGLIVFPVWVAGWASNNKYALLGAMRAVAQGIAYEIPLVLSAMVPVVFAQSMRLGDIISVQAQTHWFVIWPLGPGLIAFVIFFICSLAEANRIPFDIPEAESELVAGVATEYAGMRFGLLQMAEYLHTLISSAVAAAIFFGGWDGPFAPGLHWMVLKTLVLFFMIFWIRWSLVRFRSDQLMALCWKYLLPISLLLVMVSALFVHYRGTGA